MAASQPIDDVIIIGIDFGTTYSGVSWACSREPEEIELVTSWDAELNHCSDVDKAPTKLLYGDDDNTTWGYSVPADKDALKWFKLLLLDEDGIPCALSASTQLDKARRLQEETNKDPVDIIACFLRKLWNHAIDSIKRSIGAELLKISKFHVPGDTIVVCDAGGGTVDLISYVIESIDPFTVKECLCGGVFLDENFVKLIKSKVPRGSWDQVSKAEEIKFLNDGWEHGIKPQFANQQRTWLVDLPDACNDTPSTSRKLKRRRTLELSSEEILSVFSPIVNKIEALHIILVGGFGRSRYPFDHLQTKFESTVSQSRGSKPWTAICRGAVVHGLSRHNVCPQLGIKVEARIARMSYGVSCHDKFDRSKHREEDKVWAEDRYEYRADNQIRWFLKEGDDVTTKQPVRHNFWKLYSKPLGDISDSINSSLASPAPSRRDYTVERLCTIKWNKHVGLESLPTYTNAIGKVYHVLQYTVEMTCEDGTVDFAVYHDGKRVGAQNVEVEFDSVSSLGQTR
ncbi:hypothetical protein LRP88_08459 [Fusarium phalaenopsidis]